MKLGKGFSDSIFLGGGELKKRDSLKRLFEERIDDIDYPTSFCSGVKIAVWPFYLLLAICFFLLTGKLFYLQVLTGNYNRTLANENRIRLVKKQAPRGIIFDREGKALVRNTPAFKLKCPAEQNDCEEKILGREEALSLEVEGKGTLIETQQVREYLYPKEFAHLLGYVSEISQEELEGRGFKEKYLAGDLVGKAGVEKQYDFALRGTDGGEIVEVDSGGRILRQIGTKEPIAGKNLTLTVDLELQKKAAELMEGRRGAVVAVEPSSGKILALYSNPSFDPNAFTFAREAEVEMILKDEDGRPMFNRAISGTYHPGSTFKIVTAVAGFEEKKINESTLFDDPGEIIIDKWRYGNWYFDQYGKKEGMIGPIRAIARSCDTFFYKVGEWVGVEKLAWWARKFGLGEQLGIDLPGEAEGLVADADWKERFKGEKWFLGNTYHMAIGQGDTSLTPLQVGEMAAVIANGGKRCKPHVLQGIRVGCQEVGINQKTISLVKEGMRLACEEGGTAFPFFNFEVEREGKKERVLVAGKTGTAEYGDPQNRTHAWFTAFAPVEEPAGGLQLAVTVLVEGGGEGSYVAAPIVKELMSFWLSR
jgi:penicillin-binding protein 2